MARNVIETVIMVRDEASKQVAVIFDQFGRSARELQTSIDPATSALRRQDEAAQGHSVSLTHATRIIRSMATALGSDLSPAIGSTAGEMVSAASHAAVLSTGLAAVGAAAAAAAVILGGKLYESLKKAAEAKKEFAETTTSFDVGKLDAAIEKNRKDLAEANKRAGELREEISKRDAAIFGTAPTTTPADPVRNALVQQLKTIDETIANLGAARRQLERAKEDVTLGSEAGLEAARKGLEAAAAQFAADAIALDKAKAELERTANTLQGALSAALAGSTAKDIGQQTERAAAAKSAEAEALQGIRTIEQARQQASETEAADFRKTLALIQQGLEASRAYFAERVRLSEEETAIRVDGIQRQTEAALKGAAAELEAVRKNLESTKKEPLFSTETTEGVALRSQAATLENQAKILEQKLTDIARSGANDRAKAEEDGLKRLRDLRQQDAQQALSDLQRALAAEKAARDQARTDAQGLLGRAAASLQEQGITSGTGAQLKAEAARLAGGDTNLLNALRAENQVIDFSKIGTALSSQEQLARLGGDFSGLIQAAAAPKGPFRGPQSAAEEAVQREFLLSGRTLPEGGLFRNEQEGPAVTAARSRLAGAQSALAGPQQAAKESLDLIINTLEEDGTPRIIVIGEKFARAFTESFTQHLNLGKMADALDAALADVLTFMGQRGTR